MRAVCTLPTIFLSLAALLPSGVAMPILRVDTGAARRPRIEAAPPLARSELGPAERPGVSAGENATATETMQANNATVAALLSIKTGKFGGRLAKS